MLQRSELSIKLVNIYTEWCRERVSQLFFQAFCGNVSTFYAQECVDTSLTSRNLHQLQFLQEFGTWLRGFPHIQPQEQDGCYNTRKVLDGVRVLPQASGSTLMFLQEPRLSVRNDPYEQFEPVLPRAASHYEKQQMQLLTLRYFS